MEPRRAALLLTLVLLMQAGCSSRVQLPKAVVGEWWEEKHEAVGTSKEKYEAPGQGTLRDVLRFDQQGELAVVFVGKARKIGEEPAEWSAPYALKRGPGEGWSFHLGERDVTVALKSDGRVSVLGLMARVTGMRSREDGSLEPVVDNTRPIESVFASLASYRQVTMWFSLGGQSTDRFRFIGPTPNPAIHLRKDLVELRWCFGNINLFDKDRVIDVRVSDFVDSKDPKNRNPFGDRTEAANRFVLGAVAPSAEVCGPYAPATSEGTFTYNLTATVESAPGKKQVVTQQDTLATFH